MPVPPAQQQQGQQPSVWQKLGMGAAMGGSVGLTIGFIFGTFNILRNGAGPRGFLYTLSQYMLTSAATFGFFLSIGTVIRTDSLVEDPRWAALASRAGGVSIERMAQAEAVRRMMKQRWEAERERR